MGNAKGSRIYYGWYIVLAGAMVTGAGIGLFSNCIGVFVKPVCEALGFSRGEFVLYETISRLTMVFMMPFFGEILQRFSIRKVMLLSAAVCGMVPFAYSLSSHMWQFYLAALIGGTMLNGLTVVTVGNLINNWFYEKKGIATGIAYSGSGVVVAIMIPVTNQIIASVGWRWGYRIIGVAGLLLLLPAILFLIKDSPAQMGLLPYGAKAERERSRPGQADVRPAAGLTRKDALCSSTFWLLSAGLFLTTFVATGIQQHTIASLTDTGFSGAYASLVSSGVMIWLSLGKLILGRVYDRFSTAAGLVIGVGCVIASVAAISNASIPGVVWIYAAAVGIGCASGSVPASTLTSAYFGERDFARIFSLVYMADSFGVALGSPTLGFIYDFTGSYSLAYQICGVLSLLLALTMFFAYRKGSRQAEAFRAITARKEDEQVAN